MDTSWQVKISNLIPGKKNNSESGQTLGYGLSRDSAISIPGKHSKLTWKMALSNLICLILL